MRKALQSVLLPFRRSKRVKLFGDFPALRNFQARTFKPLVAQRIDFWWKRPFISDIFEKVRPQLDVYETFINNYNATSNFIDDCYEFKSFRSHFEQVKKEVSFLNQGLTRVISTIPRTHFSIRQGLWALLQRIRKVEHWFSAQVYDQVISRVHFSVGSIHVQVPTGVQPNATSRASRSRDDSR